MEPKLAPGEKPLFMEPEKTVGLGYPGVVEDDAQPNFDPELEALHTFDTTIPPAGKGPSRGYIERWRLIARYHAAGLTNNQIARRLGYSATGISLALKQEFVQAEIQNYRVTREYDIGEKLKEAADDGIAVVHGIILDDSEKSTTRLDAARWAIEQTRGKARQSVDVESGTLSSFMDLLKDMKTKGEPIDVTPERLDSPKNLESNSENAAGQQPNRFATWLDENLAPA